MRLWSCPWSYYPRGFDATQAGGIFIRSPDPRAVRTAERTVADPAKSLRWLGLVLQLVDAFDPVFDGGVAAAFPLQDL